MTKVHTILSIRYQENAPLTSITIYITYLRLRWVNPLIKKGWKNDLRMGDIYKWTFDSDAAQLADKLEGYVFEKWNSYSHTSLMVKTS